MNDNNAYKYYLEDLGHLIQEIVTNWKLEKSKKKLGEYDFGYEMALNQIVSLLQNQAKAFEIDLKSINLDKIDTGKDLLTHEG